MAIRTCGHEKCFGVWITDDDWWTHEPPSHQQAAGQEMAMVDYHPIVEQKGDLRIVSWMPSHQTSVVQVSAKVPLSEDEIFDLLVHPLNHTILRNQEKPTRREVMYDDGIEQHVDVVQSAVWQFLMFRGTFPVHLHIVQNRQTKTIRYKLVDKGFMNEFEGYWRVQKAGRKQSFKPSFLGRGGRNSSHSSSELILNQMNSVSVTPPFGLHNLIRKIAAHMVSNVFGDIDDECLKICKGKPTIDWHESCRNAEIKHQVLRKERPIWLPSNLYQQSSSFMNSQRKRFYAWKSKADMRPKEILADKR